MGYLGTSWSMLASNTPCREFRLRPTPHGDSRPVIHPQNSLMGFKLTLKTGDCYGAVLGCCIIARGILLSLEIGQNFQGHRILNRNGINFFWSPDPNFIDTSLDTNRIVCC